MWKIDKDGNAKNERGDEIRVKFSVESYTQQPLIPGFISGYHTEDHGEYISFEAAKAYIRKLVYKLNEEDICKLADKLEIKLSDIST